MSIHPEFKFMEAAADLQLVESYTSCRLPFGLASALPRPAYTSPVFQELENEAVWTRVWVCVGSVHEIERAEDLLPYTIGNHAIHVQRQQDGSLIGRFNKAQHGGCRSVPAQCRTGKKTKCSYTSCGHSRDRRVIPGDVLGLTAALMGQYLGDVPERLSQVKLRVEGGFIFANIDPSPDNRAEVPTLGANDVTRCGEMVWRENRANWKIAGAHLADVARSDMEGGPLKGIEATWSFPNLIRIATPNAVVAINLQPTAPDQTLWRISYFIAAGALRDTADLAVLTGAIDRAAVGAEAAQSEIERGFTHDKLEIIRAGWSFNQMMIGYLTRRPMAYWNAPLTDAMLASAP